MPKLEYVFKCVEPSLEAYKLLAEKFLATEAYIDVTSEYDGSYTSTLQNLFDHFPRQQSKVYGEVTAANGIFVGMGARQQLMLFIITLFGIVWPYKLVTQFVGKKFHSHRVLLDESFQPKIDFSLNQFNWLFHKIGMVNAP